jgi:hypothetical protein
MLKTSEVYKKKVIILYLVNITSEYYCYFPSCLSPFPELTQFHSLSLRIRKVIHSDFFFKTRVEMQPALYAYICRHVADIALMNTNR